MNAANGPSMRLRPRKGVALVTILPLIAMSFWVAVPPVSAAITTTTTTLTVPSDPVDAPDPVGFTIQVSPVPSGDPGFIPAVLLAIDGGSALPYPMQAEGTTIVMLGLSPGTHTAVASFGGIGDFGPSTSDEVSVSLGSGTQTVLYADVNPALSTVPVTFTATVGGRSGGFGSTEAPTEGTLTIRDQTSSVTLGSKAVSSGDASLVVTSTMAVGTHDLVAEYEGSGIFRSSHGDLVETITPDTAVDASGVGVTPSKFYPVADGYRDKLRARGARNEPLSVVIRVYSVKTGKLVRTASLPAGSGDYAWDWNGRSTSGKLQPSGKYRVAQQLTDAGANVASWTTTITLSRKWIHWTKVSLTKAGRAFSRVLDSGNGYVSTRRSSYANGVRLYSGSAEAGVQYKFKVHAARFYRKFSFRVLGRSPNGEQALMLIWNPDLGSYKYASSFDSPRLTGRGYHWWSRKATLSGRVVSGYARTGVIVFADGGHKPAFDIAKVRIVYQYGVLR